MRKERSFADGAANGSNRPLADLQVCCVNGRTLPNSGHLLAMCRATTGVDDEVREGDVER
jgi:hypothetical protein